MHLVVWKWPSSDNYQIYRQDNLQGRNPVTPRNSFHKITIDNSGRSTTLALGGLDDVFNTLKIIEKWNPETETWWKINLKRKKLLLAWWLFPRASSAIHNNHWKQKNFCLQSIELFKILTLWNKPNWQQHICYLNISSCFLTSVSLVSHSDPHQKMDLCVCLSISAANS